MMPRIVLCSRLGSLGVELPAGFGANCRGKRSTGVIDRLPFLPHQEATHGLWTGSIQQSLQCNPISLIGHGVADPSPSNVVHKCERESKVKGKAGRRVRSSRARLRWGMSCQAAGPMSELAADRHRHRAGVQRIAASCPPQFLRR